MPLHVHTASYAYKGPDRLDVTRIGVDTAARAGKPTPGAPFAPSGRILWPAKSHLALVAALERRAQTLEHTEAGAYTAVLAEKLLERVEEAYPRLYRVEMLASYKAHRSAWAALLAQPEVTLVCYCRRAEPGPGQCWTCHRRHLAGFLVKMGAVYVGERATGTNTEADQAKRRRKETWLGDLLAIAGCRPPPQDASDAWVALYKRILADVAETVAAQPMGTVLVHGGANGVDSAADSAAKECRFGASVVYRPWYDAWARGAPPMRNVLVATAPRAYCWPAPWSSPGGTPYAIELARAAGVDVVVRDL